MKIVFMLLGALLVYNPAVLADQTAPPSGTTQVQTQETPRAAKIKAKVQKRGIGENSRVRVKLANGTEVKGYISKIEEASFTVTDKKTGQTTTVPYSDVQKIQGPGLSKAAKITLVAVGGGVLALVLFGYCVGGQRC
jgi:RimP-like protein